MRDSPAVLGQGLVVGVLWEFVVFLSRAASLLEAGTAGAEGQSHEGGEQERSLYARTLAKAWVSRGPNSPPH